MCFIPMKKKQVCFYSAEDKLGRATWPWILTWQVRFWDEWLLWKATIKMQFFHCCCTSLTLPSGVKGHRFLVEITSNLNNSDSLLLVTYSGHIKGVMRRWRRIIYMWMGYCVLFAWHIYSFFLTPIIILWHLLVIERYHLV